MEHERMRMRMSQGELLMRWIVKKPEKRLMQRAFARWKRSDRFHQVHAVYNALVEVQKRYLLRKWTTISGLRKVAAAFARWNKFVRQSALLLKHLLIINEDQQQRKAVMRWQRAIFADKLDEEVTVRTWMRRHRRGVQALQRWNEKQQKLLLIAYWVHWRRWHRQQKCWVFNLQTKLRKRWILASWRRATTSTKLYKQRVRSTACRYVREAVCQGCDRVRLLRHIETKGEAFRTMIRKLQTFVETYHKQTEYKRLHDALRYWRVHVIPTPVKISAEESRKRQTERRRIEWTARIANNYRMQTEYLRRKKTHSHRPAWK